MNTKQFKAKYLPKAIGSAINSLGIVAPGKAAGLALDLFRTPRDGKILPYQEKFLSQFQKHTLDLDGINIATYSNGKSGRKVLLCHGWESNSSRWKKLYQKLNETDLQIIMMDAPAHGASGGEKFDALLYSQTMEAVVDYYQPEILIGHSVGGYSALYYASRVKPPSIKKLIILASPDKLTDITSRYFDMLGYSNRVRKAYDRQIESVFGERPEIYTVAKYAKELEIPGLIIHDEKDDINLYYEGKAIHNAWTKSELITTQGLGHSLQDQQVYRTITDYCLS